MANRKIGLPVFDMAGKTVIVTGGTQGLGFGIAASFAAYGADVVITARTVSKIEEAQKDLNENYCKGGKCLGIPADTGRQADIDHVIAKTVEAFGKLDILVNNAGISGVTAQILTDACSEANFDKVISTNLKGIFLFSKAAAKQMIAQGNGGRVINMASVGSLMGGKGVAAYSASKAGVLSLTRTMGNEWARYGITVNAVCPGYVVTPLNEDIFADQKIYEKMTRRVPLHRLGTIEEIAGPVMAIASDCFSYMTGAFILLDGGQMIGG